jgi:hypothetical protein
MILRLKAQVSYIRSLEGFSADVLDSVAQSASMKISALAPGTVAICLLTLFPLQSSSALDEAPQKTVEYNERVAMTTGEIRRGEVCATFYPDLVSDDFFKGLQRTDRDRVSEYRRNSVLVTTYPSRLIIQIDVRISVCDADVYTAAPAPDFLKTLHYRVQWKRALYLRPVANYTVESIPLNVDESDNRKLLVVLIHDKNVPITDHLILTILSPDGKILSRMAARP